MRTYYELLSIREDANENDIVAAYRLAVRKHHPDLNPGNASAAKLVRHLNRAREVLCDPERRKKYNEYLQQRRAKISSDRDTSTVAKETAARHSHSMKSEQSEQSKSGPTSRNAGSKSPDPTSYEWAYGAQLGRHRKKNRRIHIEILGVLFGGVGGIAIGLIIVWQVWNIDPLGLANYDLSKMFHRQVAVESSKQQDKTRSKLGSATNGTELTSVPGLGEARHSPVPSRSPIQENANPNEQIVREPEAVLQGTTEPQVPMLPVLEQQPKASTDLTSEIVQIIPALSNRSSSAQYQIPTNTQSVQLGFFGEDAELESLPAIYPGYKGHLKVNGKTVVAFARKYKWRGDGQWHTLVRVHDGKELNSRDPKTPTTGWYDVTEFVKAGEQCTNEYKNGQRSPVGVRIKVHLSSDPKSVVGPSNGKP